jgi:hypothetical protein
LVRHRQLRHVGRDPPPIIAFDLVAPAALQYSPLFVRCADPSAAAGSKKVFGPRARIRY